MCIISEYLKTSNRMPLFLQGDSIQVLRQFSDGSVDSCVTSPPYWQKRQYENGGIGLETEKKTMLGHRSVRMAITNPEIPEMQIKAVLDAAAELISFHRDAADCFLPSLLLSMSPRLGLSFHHQGAGAPGPESA